MNGRIRVGLYAMIIAILALASAFSAVPARADDGAPPELFFPPAVRDAVGEILVAGRLAPDVFLALPRRRCMVFSRTHVESSR